jgi:hypothetical protein
MILPAYGGQESDCISARFAHIPAEVHRLPSNKRQARGGIPRPLGF